MVEIALPGCQAGTGQSHGMTNGSTEIQREQSPAAESLGIAMQLTNILRDVGSDLGAGQIYLPSDELALFDVTPSHLVAYRERALAVDERFRALMRFQIARARRFYAAGMAGIWLLPADCRLPILVAARLYRCILTVIERNHYDVFSRRAATTYPEKVREAALALSVNWLWQRGRAASPCRTGSTRCSIESRSRCSRSPRRCLASALPGEWCARCGASESGFPLRIGSVRLMRGSRCSCRC